MLNSIKKKIVDFWNDTEASDTTEMIMTTAMLSVLIICAIMLLSYAVEFNNVAHATKRVTRGVEVTGYANVADMNSKFDTMLGSSAQIVNRRVELVDGTFMSGSRVQLKDTFKVKGACDYNIPLINPGNFSGLEITMPIEVVVTGISEVYFPS